MTAPPNPIIQVDPLRRLTLDGKDILGEINADGDNGHGFPFHKTSELMRDRAFRRGIWMPHSATARITWDGEAPFVC